jgi:L-aspartate oxidase
VAHAGGSATGRRILRQLSAGAAEHPLIAILEGQSAAALARDAGGRVVGTRLADGTIVLARAVLLATGGAAALWSRTTNPPGSFGSGMMLARHAGADLADLELVQFHPTAVTGISGREGFLVSEAIRGEGATLHDETGERFVDELAPRDAVARAIHRRLLETGAANVWLDMTRVDPGRFPNIVGALREAGLDPTTSRVPVSPAAHYMMGGVVTDLHGRATTSGLYAIGECACTGLHGANRLASNSLSECFVFGRRAALAGLDEPMPPRDAGTRGADVGRRPALASLDQPVPPSDAGPRGTDVGAPVAPPPSPAIRAALWRHAGLERDAASLRPLVEAEHPLARLVGICALAREETRGAHVRTDFPVEDPALDGRHGIIPAAGDEVAQQRWN